MASVKITVQQGDATTIDADVLALKYAQALYGVDENVAYRLSERHPRLLTSLPSPGDKVFLPAAGTMVPRYALFVGVPAIHKIEYATIRDLGKRLVIGALEQGVQISRIAMTVHGPGFGLDEREAFRSQIAGILDALQENELSRDLREIVIVEIDPRRAQRLSVILEQTLPAESVHTEPSARDTRDDAQDFRRSAGAGSDRKPKVFVAMPFDDRMDDVYHYGILNAVHAAGFLCERADQAAFTGEIMEWVKKRISSADIVIADLTHSNPNVYLEVGYAWGTGRPTVLLVQDPEHLKFDVKGQRCLVYTKIKQLEQLLARELQALL
jgi:hypothetical protein